MAKGPGRRERRRIETRDRLFRCALQQFAERGFSGTTIEDITNAADVGRGTFFNYFPSKEHVFALFVQLRIERLSEIVTADDLSREPLDRLLHRMVGLLTEEFEDYPALLQSFIVSICSNEDMRQLLIGGFESGREQLSRLFSMRQQRKEIREDFPPMALAFQFQRSLSGTLLIWSLFPERPLKEHLQEMVGILWAAMRREP